MVLVGVQNICSQSDIFQAKFRMMRKERDPQVARWAQSVPPKHQPESQSAKKNHWSLTEACNTCPLWPLSLSPEKPGYNKSPSVTAIQAPLHCVLNLANHSYLWDWGQGRKGKTHQSPVNWLFKGPDWKQFSQSKCTPYAIR